MQLAPQQPQQASPPCLTSCAQTILRVLLACQTALSLLLMTLLLLLLLLPLLLLPLLLTKRLLLLLLLLLLML